MGKKNGAVGAPAPAQISWWWAWGATAVGGLVLTLGSAGLGASISVGLSFWILMSAVVVVGGVFLVAWPQVKSRGREKRRARAVTDFNDGLSSLYSALSRFLRVAPTQEAREAFFKSTLEAATGLFAMDGIRVCVYILDSDDDLDGDKDRFLRLEDSAGRSDPPRRQFMPGTEHGDALIDATVAGRQVTVHSRENTGDFKIDYHSGTVWRSFFTIPLSWKDAAVGGVLTVDRREETKFTSEDITIGWTVARLLLIGLDKLYGAAKNTGPEVSEAMDKLNAVGEERSSEEAPDGN